MLLRQNTFMRCKLVSFLRPQGVRCSAKGCVQGKPGNIFGVAVRAGVECGVAQYL